MKHLPPMTDKLPSITINPLLIHDYESGNNSLFLPVQPPHGIATAIGTAAARNRIIRGNQRPGPGHERWSRKPPKKPLNGKPPSISGNPIFRGRYGQVLCCVRQHVPQQHPVVIFVFHKQEVRQDCKTTLPVKPPVSDPKSVGCRESKLPIYEPEE